MTDDELQNMYRSIKVIAVVGASIDPQRPSHQVASYLMAHGYRIIPINPKYKTVLGQTCYPDLMSAQRALSPQTIDVVDIFRRSEYVSPHIDEAIKIGAKIVWMQEGIVNREAAAKAQTAGLLVEMDRCFMKEHTRLMKRGKVND